MMVAALNHGQIIGQIPGALHMKKDMITVQQGLDVQMLGVMTGDLSMMRGEALLGLKLNKIDMAEIIMIIVDMRKGLTTSIVIESIMKITTIEGLRRSFQVRKEIGSM